MIDLYPHARATLKASTFFSSVLSGFLDTASRFKVFINGETPTDETPFITVEIEPGDMNGNNDWSQPFITFTVHGPDTDRPKLWAIAREIRAIFKALSEFAEVQQTFTAATSDLLTAAQHGLKNGDIVTVSSSGTLPGGLSALTDYYVVSATIDTFKLSMTENGGAIDITNVGSGTHKVIQKPVPYALIGPAIFDQGQNPVTEHVTVSVALRFGIDV